MDASANRTSTQPHRLFVGNYDDGIQLRVLNVDDAFVGGTTGGLARKCIEVAPRAVHTLGREEAALLYEPLPDSFCAYYESLYGYRPRVYAPSGRYTDPTKPLSLVRAALDDEALLARIGRDGTFCEWSLDAFIGNPLIFDLGRRTGLPVAGMDEERVRAGGVIRLNDKRAFQHTCIELNIPVPPSRHVVGWASLVRAAREIYGRTGAVFLRRTRAAGGLGNLKVTREDIQGDRPRAFSAYLDRHLTPRAEWETEIVLVEPVLQVVASPTVLAHVQGGVGRVVAVIDQVLEGGESYIGGDFPSSVPGDIQDQLKAWMERYLTDSFIPMGGAGWVDMDFGVLTDGSIVAFESNARTTGNNHGIAIADRLLGDRAVGDIFTWTNDKLVVAPGTLLEEVLERVGTEILWDAQRGDGIVISIPPAGDDHHFCMGYVALAQTHERKLALRDAMDAFARCTWDR